MTPLFRGNFWTEGWGRMGTKQHEPLAACPDFEMRLLECMEAYGKDLGRWKCKDYNEDFSECVYKKKTNESIEKDGTG